jgi:HD domain
MAVEIKEKAAHAPVKVGVANERYLLAVEFAAARHGAVRQERKGTQFPYIVHPIRVAEILERFKYDEDVVIAGLLHDTVEDAGVKPDEILDAFGARVAELVMKASEDAKADWTDARKKESWCARKGHTIAAVRAENDPDALGLIAADKLDNIRSLAETLRAKGKKTWDIFNAGKAKQHWYYRTLAEELLKKDPKSLLFRTLDAEVHRVFPDTGHETRFYAGKALATPQDARAYLADPIRHWRPEYSAFELAHAWIDSQDTPCAVDTLLREALGDYELIEGFFEKETPLGTPGNASQTDLLLVLRADGGFAVAAIEGKAREPFGQYVREWNDGSPTKEARLASLKEQLGMTDIEVSGLRYQLLHRTVAALREATRYGAPTALMIVHAFGEAPASFDDFSEFTAALGIETREKDALSLPKELHGVTLRLAWAQDRHR